MSETGQIIGNEKSLNYFRDAAKQGKLSHAYIVCGQKGSGKQTFTDYVVKMLFCSDAAAPCGKCASCIKHETGNHPDVIRLKREKETIRVDEIREQINEDIAIKPYYGPYKIYIINEAHLMNANAQNALLKTIEEPPAYGMIFLLTDNPDALLETVRSRCLKIDMELLDDAQIEAELKKAGVEDAAMIRAAAAYANGNLGLAKELCESGADAQAFHVAELLKGIARYDALKIYEEAKEAEKGDARKMLDVIYTWFRDVLALKTGGAEARLFFPGHRAALSVQAERLGYEDIGKLLGDINKTLEELNFNVKTDAAIEALLLAIREALR